MTNLLPQQEQVNIKKEYKHRRLVVIFSALVVMFVVSAGFLVPSFMLSNVKLREVSFDAEQARRASEDLQKTKSVSSALLKDAEKKLSLLIVDKNKNKNDASDVIRLVTDNKSDRVRIQSITYEMGKDKIAGKMTVAGIAKDRDSLTEFVKILESQKLFTKVDLPVSNFAKDKDINFSISISGTF